MTLRLLQVVGVGFPLIRVPGPSARLVGVGQRNHVVNVQLGGFGNRCTGHSVVIDLDTALVVALALWETG